MTEPKILDSLFQPKSIAVVGASASTVSGGNRFIRNLRAFGYAGPIYPVHPSAGEIEGLPVYASLEALPETVDYAYVATAAERVPGVIRSGRGKVRVAQVMSSGFGETQEGDALQQDLLAAARDADVRVVGPNCLGVYSPRARVSFTRRVTDEPGHVGVVCQSGGLGTDIIRRGQHRGLRFSGLVTIGNAVDVSASELLEYFLADEQTRVIGMYLESARDGRRLFEVLRQAGCRKPVVLLKGGGTAQGRRAASSHTGALAGSEQAWAALGKQTGMPIVDTLDEFLDVLLLCQCLQSRPQPTRTIALFGNGGGTSVLGTDACGRAGFAVPPFAADTLAALEALKLPAGSSVLNPVDVPAGALQQNEGRAATDIVRILAQDDSIDAVIIHANMTVITDFQHVDMLKNIIAAVTQARQHGRGVAHLILVLRSDGDAEIEERKRGYRRDSVQAGIPVFDEIAEAAKALACLRVIEAVRCRRAQPSIPIDGRSRSVPESASQVS